MDKITNNQEQATYAQNVEYSMATSPPAVTAAYSGPATSAPFTVEVPLQGQFQPSGSVEAKTAYLASLRSATEAIQDRVNRELTTRMEEDNAREVAASGKPLISAEEAAKEEQNYGEDERDEED